MGIFSGIKIVVHLEIGRNAILALNRKRQFSYLIMANILARAWIRHKINSTNSHEFRRWLDMPLDFIPQKGKKGINHNSKILHGTWQYFCIPKVEKDRRISGKRWGDQQIKENDGSIVSAKEIFKFQKLELGF